MKIKSLVTFAIGGSFLFLLLFLLRQEPELAIFSLKFIGVIGVIKSFVLLFKALIPTDEEMPAVQDGDILFGIRVLLIGVLLLNIDGLLCAVYHIFSGTFIGDAIHQIVQC